MSTKLKMMSLSVVDGVFTIYNLVQLLAITVPVTLLIVRLMPPGWTSWVVAIELAFAVLWIFDKAYVRVIQKIFALRYIEQLWQWMSADLRRASTVSVETAPELHRYLENNPGPKQCLQGGGELGWIMATLLVEHHPDLLDSMMSVSFARRKLGALKQLFQLPFFWVPAGALIFWSWF